MFFLCLISYYLQKPEQNTVYEGATFEDFCIGQFVAPLAEKYLADMFPWSMKQQFDMKQVALTEWQEIRNRRNASEAYLRISFAEDVQHSRSEMWQLQCKIK